MTTKLLKQFRTAVYQTIGRRADSLMDLVDGLSCAERVSSPVAVSEVKPAFRRKFSSVYDALRHAVIDEPGLRRVLQAHLPGECQRMGGYDVYVLDTTFLERSEAKTLADRRCFRQGTMAAVEYGHKYSWLMRLVEGGSSWVAPVDVERVPSDRTDNQVGQEQVKRLAANSPRPKVVLADSSYGNQHFVKVLREVQDTAILVRLRHNRCLCEAVPPEPPRPGRRRIHGIGFKLSDPVRPPDRQAKATLPNGRFLCVSAWQHLHLKNLADLEGLALRVEVFNQAGQPYYERPIFLFWTGNPEMDPLELVNLYFWRFSIEHAFRFFKQQLGLNRCRSTHLPTLKRWVWCCLLAYWQLLLLRHQLDVDRPAWYPQRKQAPGSTLTPRLVQRNAPRFFSALGSPALPPKRTGKGSGRPPGYHPPPRTRYKPVPTLRQRALAATSPA